MFRVPTSSRSAPPSQQGEPGIDECFFSSGYPDRDDRLRSHPFRRKHEFALRRSKLHDGDIIFEQSQTSQSVALREATGSPWTHMGIVLLDRNDLRVLEAGMNGVAYASLDSFVGRSRERRVIVKRLRDEGRLTSDARARMHASRGDLGKDYDNLFEWSV